MTKEEFNDFFSETPLRTKSATPQPKPEDEPPSEILASLSKLFGKKQEADKPRFLRLQRQPLPPRHHHPRPRSPRPAPQPPVVPAVPAPPPVPEPPEAPEPKAEAPKPAPLEVVPKEPLNVSSALASILSKLNSIEKRLANIEAKITES